VVGLSVKCLQGLSLLTGAILYSCLWMHMHPKTATMATCCKLRTNIEDHFWWPNHSHAHIRCCLNTMQSSMSLLLQPWPQSSGTAHMSR
jgi:hypothetical protein